MDFIRLANQVKAEIDVSNLTDAGIYRFVLKQVNDVDVADAFMLSDLGGFTKGQLSRIKQRQKQAVTTSASYLYSYISCGNKRNNKAHHVTAV